MFKIPDDYALRIQEFRERRGLTQARLARLLGVTSALVSQWENGKARPGEPVFDRLGAPFAQRYGLQALQGATFIDPTAQEAYLFHLVLVEITRQADTSLPALAHAAPVTTRLVGVRQTATGQTEETPVEHLLLLRSGPGVYGPYLHFVARIVECGVFLHKPPQVRIRPRSIIPLRHLWNLAAEKARLSGLCFTFHHSSR